MKRFWLIWSVIGTVLAPGAVFAAALEGPGLGARAVSMGGAFVGLADDWTAVYWNPAGLAQLREPGFGVTVDFAFAESNDGNSVANPPAVNADQNDLFFQLPGNAASEPARFRKTEMSNNSQLPGLGFYLPLGEDYTLALASYLRLGDDSRWSDTVARTNGAGQVEAAFNTRTYLSVFNLSLARRCGKKFLLGAGLNFLYMESDLHAQKTVTGSGGYTYQTDTRSDGNGYEGVFGFLYKPIGNFSLGGVYRTGSQITLAGRSSASTSAGAGTVEDSDSERDFNHPPSYGLGLAFKPSSKLTLTADWQRTDWGQTRDERRYVRGSGVLLKNSNRSSGWKDTNFYRLGAEYKPFEEGLALRLGYYYDESPLPNKAVSMTNLVEVNRQACTAGVGYETRESSLALAYIYTWGKETIYNVNYEKSVHSIQAAFSHYF